MKKIKAYFMVATMAIFGATTFNACTDACKDVTCVNGECSDGDCECDEGYEGTECETAMNTKFLGVFNVTDACVSGYSQTITAGTAANEIVFSNLGNFTNAAVVKATVDGTSLTISNYTDGAGRKFQGTGTISAGTITMNYIVTYSDNSTETCDPVILAP